MRVGHTLARARGFKDLLPKEPCIFWLMDDALAGTLNNCGRIVISHHEMFISLKHFCGQYYTMEWQAFRTGRSR